MWSSSWLRTQLQFMMVSLVLFIDIIRPAKLWPWDWVDLASNRNEYQEYFLGGKGSRFTTFMCQLSQNLGASTSWNPWAL